MDPQSVDHSASRDWRRNQIALTTTTFIGFTGFTLVMPFLPLYFRELGVTDAGEIALWSGLSWGVTPALAALLSLTWGRLADRFGRKLMVQRSLLGFIGVMATAAFVTEAWHLLALRIVHGFFAGYASLIVSMAAVSAPRGRMSQAIGRIQMAQRLGPALGPVLGGLFAQLVGLRPAFLVASGFYVVAFFLMLFMYREPASPKKGTVEDRTKRVTFRNVLAFQNFFLLMVVIFGIQYVDRSFGPVLPLFIAQLGVDRVPLVSGILFSVGAGAAAVGHQITGPLFRYGSPRLLLVATAVVAAGAVGVYAVASQVALLLIARLVFGLAMGVGLTLAYSAAGSVIPSGVHATGFGFLASASQSALALSPVVSGFLAATSIRAVFALDAVALVVLAGLVSRVMVERPVTAEAPRVEEA